MDKKDLEKTLKVAVKQGIPPEVLKEILIEGLTNGGLSINVFKKLQEFFFNKNKG